MIENSFAEVHDENWKDLHLPDRQHELYILGQVVPWQQIVDGLIPYYSADKGRFGKNIRVMSSMLILGKQRKLSDQGVIELVQENRYAQHFCNVSDKERLWFLERTALVRFRQRIGVTGCERIEALIFETLRRCGAIVNDMALIDSSVLANNVIYPNDVDLLYKAFCKMESWSKRFEIKVWWDHGRIKRRWRAYNLGKKKERLRYLLEFQTLFVSASKIFQKKVRSLRHGEEKKTENIG